MQAPYTLLRKNKKLLSLKVVLKKKMTSVNLLQLTYPGNYLLNMETNLRTTGFLPFFCSPLLAASVGSASGSLGSSCSLVKDRYISSPWTCISRSLSGSSWPQCLRKFIKRLQIVSLVGMLPPNATKPWSMTGGSAETAMDYIGRPCTWGSLPQALPQGIYCYPYLPSGRVRHWGIQQGLGIRH